MQLFKRISGISSPRSDALGTWVPLAAAIALSCSGVVRAATITVNDTTADSVVGTTCTIVDAVAAINLQTPVNGCIAGDGANDTIDLTGFIAPTSISFVQAATGHALVLSKPATIRGALDSNGTPLVTLNRSSVTGTPNFGLIQTTAILTVEKLALQNGYADNGYLGGAILAGSALTLNNCVVSGNSSSSAGGGIAASNGITVNNSKITGNTADSVGGGIYSTQTVSVYYSTISYNVTRSATGGGGGGIYSTGNTIAVHSNVSNNISATNGGGIASANLINVRDSTIASNIAQNGSGGGLNAMNNGVSATRSTINGNSATTTGGGLNGSSAEVTNSTITGNTSDGVGGGVYALTVTMNYSTIFANTSQSGLGGGVNFATSGTINATIIYGDSPDDLNTASHSTPDGTFNLIGVSGWGVPADTISCNPMLGTLGDFGGPTHTLPLLSGSCAIDAAAANPTQTTDQRGYPRPVLIGNDPKSDIGAFEAGSSDPDVIFIDGFE